MPIVSPMSRVKTRNWIMDSVITLYVVSDTHYGDQNSDLGDPVDRMITALNEMPGKVHPINGIIDEPDAVIITGDCVHESAEGTARFAQDFRLDGTGDVPWPAYILDGNHDQAPVRTLITQRHKSLNWGVKIKHVWFQAFTENYTSPSVNTPPTAAQINAVAATMASRPVGEPTVLMVHRSMAGFPVIDNPSGGYASEWAPDALDALEDLAQSKNTLCILNGHDHLTRRETWRGFRVYSPGSITQSPQAGGPYSSVYPEALNVMRIGNTWMDVANYNFGYAGAQVNPRNWAPDTWNWYESMRISA